MITGSAAADYTVTQPTVSVIPAGGVATFTIEFDPSSSGNRTARVWIDNNDCDEFDYNFAIRGRGKKKCNSPAMVNNNSIETSDIDRDESGDEQDAMTNAQIIETIELDASLFPNPNDGEFTLVVENMPDGNVVMRIFNELGQLVKEERITQAKTMYDFGSLTSGLYYIHVVTDKESVIMPMIVRDK